MSLNKQLNKKIPDAVPGTVSTKKVSWRFRVCVVVIIHNSIVCPSIIAAKLGLKATEISANQINLVH